MTRKVELLNGDTVVGVAELRDDLSIRWDATTTTTITGIRVLAPFGPYEWEPLDGSFYVTPGLEFTIYLDVTP